MAAETRAAETPKSAVSIAKARRNATTSSATPPANTIVAAPANVSGAMARGGFQPSATACLVPIATPQEGVAITATMSMAMVSALIAVVQAYAATATEQDMSHRQYRCTYLHRLHLPLIIR